jgi:hypothetical protein
VGAEHDEVDAVLLGVAGDLPGGGAFEDRGGEPRRVQRMPGDQRRQLLAGGVDALAEAVMSTTTGSIA